MDTVRGFMIALLAGLAAGSVIRMLMTVVGKNG
jgi:hypothetical protein